MSIPPIPALDLNITDLNVDAIHIKDISFDELHLGISTSSIQCLLIGLFLMVLFQTLGIAFIAYRIKLKTHRSNYVTGIGESIVTPFSCDT